MTTHYIITNRGITSRGGKNYLPVNTKEFIRIDGDEEARDNLRYGTITFDAKKAKKLKDYTINILPDLNGEALTALAESGAVPEGKKLPSHKIFTELYEKGRAIDERNKNLDEGDAIAHGDILFFIHGYHTDLTILFRTLHELHNQYVVPADSPIAHIVLFTWPAKAQLLKYRDDARDAVKSGYALARSVASLKDFFRKTFLLDGKEQCHQKIHMLCHSMGNRVLESMFASLNEMHIEVNSMFGEIFLMAADVDYDALEKPKPLYRLLDMGERIHVYYHHKDQALGISELTKNAFNRLGRWGAKNTLALPDDIYQSDVSDIRDDEGFINDTVNHWYYFTSPSVVQDVKDVMNGHTSVFTL